MEHFTVSFKCSRGVRQGDPLSPLLFCPAEDMLNRLISSMVTSGLLALIKGPRNVQVLAHILYANDVIIFCKESIANIKTLVLVFRSYAVASGQVVNCSKYFIYGGATTAARLNILRFIWFQYWSLFLHVPQSLYFQRKAYN
ncbi:unnamed protein product [Vicia faba]|uniref:Reverse transcriptase domain-containing protein n=1 Tax=Vicia faba TaxID=3906 RepID=A0AAV1AVQ4_VICFA|nr:unnamed protein product [Vicia faba]